MNRGPGSREKWGSGSSNTACPTENIIALLWHYNGRGSIWNHQPHDCLLNLLFRRTSKKIQSSASLAFVWGSHRGPVNSPHKWPVTQKMFPFDDVIMWCAFFSCDHIMRSYWFHSIDLSYLFIHIHHGNFTGTRTISYSQRSFPDEYRRKNWPASNDSKIWYSENWVNISWDELYGSPNVDKCLLVD